MSRRSSGIYRQSIYRISSLGYHAIYSISHYVTMDNLLSGKSKGQMAWKTIGEQSDVLKYVRLEFPDNLFIAFHHLVTMLFIAFLTM